jgi:hypothetical protein
LRTARLRSPGETAEADCRGLAAARAGYDAGRSRPHPVTGGVRPARPAPSFSGASCCCGSRIGTRQERREVSSAFAGGALVLLFGGLYGGVRWRARLP